MARSPWIVIGTRSSCALVGMERNLARCLPVRRETDGLLSSSRRHCAMIPSSGARSASVQVARGGGGRADPFVLINIIVAGCSCPCSCWFCSGGGGGDNLAMRPTAGVEWYCYWCSRCCCWF